MSERLCPKNVDVNSPLKRFGRGGRGNYKLLHKQQLGQKNIRSNPQCGLATVTNHCIPCQPCDNGTRRKPSPLL